MCLEALVRWNQPDYGLIHPEMFIPPGRAERIDWPDW